MPLFVLFNKVLPASVCL